MERKEDNRDYWNHRSRTFALDIDQEIREDRHRVWQELFQKELPGSGLSVLDDGTGPGLFAMLLAEMGHQVTAIDYSEDMVAEAEKRCRDAGYTIKAEQMDAQNLRFADESFDAVVSRNMIWTLDYPEKAYAEISRVLKPGGCLILQDGNHYLYMHEERYAALQKEKERLGKTGSTVAERYGKQDYDFSVLYEIADDLPLSKTLRPAWDLETLIELGFDELRADIRRDGGLPMQFTIIARKAK